MKGGTFAATLCGTIVALLCLAGSAEATTFCVPSFHAACPNNGTNVAQANLETAITSNASDGVPDSVIVAAGHTYTDAQSLEPAGNDDLLILGGGPSTVITTSSVSNIYVVNLAFGGNGREITMQDLTVEIPASLPDNQGAAMQLSNDHLIDVDFRSQNPGSSALSSIIGGVTVAGGTYNGAGAGSLLTAIRADGNATGNVAISGIDVTSAYGVGGGGSSASMSVDDSSFTTANVGIDATAGATIDVSNSLFVTASGVALSAFTNTAANSVVNADGITAYDLSGVSNVPLSAIVMGAATTGSATVNVENSIADGYGAANGYTRNSQGIGPANVNVDYSNTPPNGSNSGPGAATWTHSITMDPLFTAQAFDDYSLSPNSPSIDAGDPAATLDHDLEGSLRPQDGDGNGTAIVDQGAFERGDTTAPNTVIDSGPAAGSTIGSSQAIFAFHGTPAGDTAKVQCKLDGGAYADCTSPKTFSDLGDGSHTVRFRAEDTVGNQEASPAARTFTVDTTPPDTVIDSGPANGATITTKQATFGFHGSPAAGTTKVQCKLDGGSFADCTSPKTFSSLSDGSHTVSFRAEDATGNRDATPATRTFTVDAAPAPDKTAPETTLDSGPGKKAKKGKVKFAFSANEKSTFECSLVKQGKPATFEPCSSPQSYKLKRKKKTGKYLFAVRATDAKGNVDKTPATAKFKVKKKKQ